MSIVMIFIDPKMFETMYEGAKKNNYPDIITTGIAPTKQDEKFQNTTDNIQRREGYLQSIKRDPMIIFWESPACWNKIFRKDKIKDLKISNQLYVGRYSIYLFNDGQVRYSTIIC